jgi:hypothetical protein
MGARRAIIDEPKKHLRGEARNPRRVAPHVGDECKKCLCRNGFFNLR